MKRSTPLQRLTPLRRTKGIPRVSEKRADENAHYRALCIRFLNEHSYCQVCLDRAKRFGKQDIGHGASMSVKVRHAVMVHHKGRRYGKWLLDTRWFLAVCQEDHDHIEHHGDWAREQGYLLTPEQRRAITPTVTPL